MTDGLGSFLSLTDASGVVQTEYAYGSFGQAATSGTSSNNSIQYTGRENDGTGLQYNRARYYSATLQRFISEDPIGFASGDTNFYAYVGNNPINKIDPFGLDDADREWEERNKPPSPNWGYGRGEETSDNPPNDPFFTGRKPCPDLGLEGDDLAMASMGAIAIRRPHPGMLILGLCVAAGILIVCANTDCSPPVPPGGRVRPFPPHHRRQQILMVKEPVAYFW